MAIGPMFCAIVTAAIILLPVSGQCQQPAPYAGAAALIDVASGRIIYEKNMSEELPMASTTKIMTAITAIEEGQMKDTVIASIRAQNMAGSSIYLTAGEKLTLEELLYGLMLQSGNDAAVAIAEHIGGNIEGFVGKMNKKAAQIGAVNTNYANPHGLDETGHYTTAEDLARVTAYALKNVDFAQIVATKQRRIPWWGKDYSRVLNNKNKTLWQVEGGDGVKTGFTNKAGRCLVASATRGGWQLAAVVLNCGPMWEETKALLEYGFKTYEPVTVLKKGQLVRFINVAKGKVERVGLSAEETLRIPLTSEEKERIVLTEDLVDFLEAPVIKGQKAGSLKITLDGKVLAKTDLICREHIAKRSIRSIIPDILKYLFMKEGLSPSFFMLNTAGR